MADPDYGLLHCAANNTERPIHLFDVLANSYLSSYPQHDIEFVASENQGCRSGSKRRKFLVMSLPLWLFVPSRTYFMDSNWATGEEVVTFRFDARQSFELLRHGKPLFR
jgi:hypothetical protein